MHRWNRRNPSFGERERFPFAVNFPFPHFFESVPKRLACRNQARESIENTKSLDFQKGGTVQGYSSIHLVRFRSGKDLQSRFSFDRPIFGDWCLQDFLMTIFLRGQRVEGGLAYSMRKRFPELDRKKKTLREEPL